MLSKNLTKNVLEILVLICGQTASMGLLKDTKIGGEGQMHVQAMDVVANFGQEWNNI